MLSGLEEKNERVLIRVFVWRRIRLLWREKIQFCLGDVLQPVLGKLHCSSRPPGTHLWPWNMFRKCFHFSKPRIPLQGIEVQCSFCDRKFNFYFILNSLPLTQSLRHFLELGELATRRFLGKRQKIRLQDSALPLNWTFFFFKTFAIIPKFYLPYLSIEFF